KSAVERDPALRTEGGRERGQAWGSASGRDGRRSSGGGTAVEMRARVNARGCCERFGRRGVARDDLERDGGEHVGPRAEGAGVGIVRGGRVRRAREVQRS